MWLDKESQRKSVHSMRNELQTIHSGCDALLSDPKHTDTTEMIAKHMLAAVAALELLSRNIAFFTTI